MVAKQDRRITKGSLRHVAIALGELAEALRYLMTATAAERTETCRAAAAKMRHLAERLEAGIEEAAEGRRAA